MAIPFYSDVEFKNNIEQKGVFINKRNYKNVLQFNCVDSLCCAFIKTKIPVEFSYCMPYIHIYGYDYSQGLLDLSLGFYIHTEGENKSKFADVHYNAINSTYGFPLELTSYTETGTEKEYVGIKIDFRNFNDSSFNYSVSFVIDCIESMHTKDTSSYYLNWDVDYCKYDSANNQYQWYETSKDSLGVNNESTTTFGDAFTTTGNSITDITHPEEPDSSNIIANDTYYKKRITPKQIARELDGYSNTKLGSIGSNVEFKLNSSTENNDDYIPFVLGSATKGKIGYSRNLKFNPNTGTLTIGNSTMNSTGFTIGQTTINSNGFTVGSATGQHTRIQQTTINTHTIAAGQLDVGKYTVGSPTDTGQIKVKCIQGQGYSNWGDANGETSIVLYRPDSKESIIGDIDKRLTDLGFKKGELTFNVTSPSSGTDTSHIYTLGKWGIITLMDSQIKDDCKSKLAHFYILDDKLKFDQNKYKLFEIREGTIPFPSEDINIGGNDFLFQPTQGYDVVYRTSIYLSKDGIVYAQCILNGKGYVSPPLSTLNLIRNAFTYDNTNFPI